MMTLNTKHAVAKLNELLGSRFGVLVEYISVGDRAKNHAVTLETVKRNASAPLIVGHNQLIVPCHIEGVLAGATRVADINGLEPRDLSEILATIHLVTREHLLTEDRDRGVDDSEFLIESPSNILTFHKRSQAL